MTIESARFEDKTWIKVSSTYEAPPETAHDAAAEGEDDAGGEGDTPEESPAVDAQAEAETLAGKLAGWAFAISDYKADPLAKRMKDLLAQPPAEDQEAGGAGDDLGDFMPPLDEGSGDEAE